MNDNDYFVLGAILNALYDSPVPLSTVEVWHAARGYNNRCSYGEVRRLLRSPEVEGIKVKMQMNGYGRRDYYLSDEQRRELDESGFRDADREDRMP